MAKVLFASRDADAFAATVAAVDGTGHDVLASDQVADIARLIKKHIFEVLVVELNLADVSGPGIISLIRQQCPRVAIIAVAEEYSRELDLRLRQDGIVHLAVKPFDSSKLTEVILHCLEQGRKTAEAGS